MGRKIRSKREINKILIFDKEALVLRYILEMDWKRVNINKFSFSPAVNLVVH